MALERHPELMGWALGLAEVDRTARRTSTTDMGQVQHKLGLAAATQDRDQVLTTAVAVLHTVNALSEQLVKAANKHTAIIQGMVYAMDVA